MKCALVLLFVTLFFSEVFCQTSEYQPDFFADSTRTQRMKAAFPVIRNMYELYMKEQQIPGLAFGIVSGGKLIYTASIGTQEILKGRPVTTSSVFRIASMTKSFTAMAILKLRDAGKLTLEDPVIKYVPELKKTHLLTADAKPITIRNLLTHTAGFPEDNPWADRQLDITDEELLAFINRGISMAYIPGQSFEYSNLGFAILGHIITKVSGQPFEKYISSNILIPLKMNHTYWEYSAVPVIALVHGYRLTNGQWKEEELLHAGAFGATGGLLTSIEDFSKYMMLHLSAWPAGNQNENGIIETATLREMHTQGPIARLKKQTRNLSNHGCATITSYNNGLAWSKDCLDRVVIQHSGGLPGFGSNWIFLPDYDIAVVSMTNLTYAAPNELDNKVVDTLIKIARLAPRITHPSAILQQRQKQLLKVLPGWNRNDTSLFSGNFFKDYSIDSLWNEAKVLFLKIGRINHISDVIPVNQLRGYFIITGTTGKLDVWFTLTPEKPALIQEYKLSEH